MRIIIGRDYYDSALAHGRDDAVVFVREKDTRWTNDEAKRNGFREPDLSVKFVRLDGEPVVQPLYASHHRYRAFEHDRQSHYFDPVAAYFCGKLYRGLRVETRNHDRPYGESFHHFWKLDALEAWLRERQHGWQDGEVYAWLRTQPTGLATYFDPQPVRKEQHEFLYGNRITVLTYVPKVNEEKPWRVNGDNLKSLEFFRAMDPYAAFQEISMWVANLAQPGREMVEIADDRVKIHKAGFDPKTSFRKAKQS